MIDTLWILKDAGPEWEIDHPATLPEVVAWLREQGVGEEVSVGLSGRPLKGTHHKIGKMFPPGRYLVVPWEPE